MANAIRAEKGYTLYNVERDDEAPKAVSQGAIIAWEVGNDGAKPITFAGSAGGEYLVRDADGRVWNQEGKSFRTTDEAMQMGGDEGPKFKTQQEADQAVVSGPPNKIEGQTLRPSPTVPEDEVRVDSFNTVNEEDTQLSRTAEKKEAAGDVSQESPVEPEGFQANPEGRKQDKPGQQESSAPRGRPRKQ
jgi:hypothetical protein